MSSGPPSGGPVRVFALCAACLVVAGCASGSGSTPASSPQSTAATAPTTEPEAVAAATVCGELRTFVNGLADVANAAVDGIGSLGPEERVTGILEGFEAGLAAIERQRPRFTDLDLPDIPERDALRNELVAGLDAATAELRDEQANLVGRSDELAAESAQGLAGTWFNAIEKAMSVSEPQIHRYPREEFQQAFLDEPQCRHVIQQFEVTGSS